MTVSIVPPPPNKAFVFVITEDILYSVLIIFAKVIKVIIEKYHRLEKILFVPHILYIQQ